MITAERVQQMITMTADTLTQGIRTSGVKNDQFVYANFVGISNGNQFIYNVGVQVAESVKNRKVVVGYCPTRQTITVSY